MRVKTLIDMCSGCDCEVQFDFMGNVETIQNLSFLKNKLVQKNSEFYNNLFSADINSYRITKNGMLVINLKPNK